MTEPSDPGQYPPVPPVAPMGPVTTQFARLDPGPSQVFGIVGGLLTALGALLVVLGFTVFAWFKGPTHQSRFGDLHRILTQFDGAVEGLAKAYFGWLGWALLAVAAFAALVACAPTVGGPFRIFAPAVAIGAIAVTFFAIQLYKPDAVIGIGIGYSTYLKDARFGFYLVVAGFVLIGAGGALGPRRGRS